MAQQPLLLDEMLAPRHLPSPEIPSAAASAETAPSIVDETQTADDNPPAEPLTPIDATAPARPSASVTCQHPSGCDQPATVRHFIRFLPPKRVEAESLRWDPLLAPAYCDTHGGDLTLDDLLTREWTRIVAWSHNRNTPLPDPTRAELDFDPIR